MLAESHCARKRTSVNEGSSPTSHLCWAKSTASIEIQKPVYTDRLAIEEMSRAGNANGVLRLMFKDDYRRFLAALNDTGDDAEEIALGVFIDIQTHFYGEGIMDELGTFPM